jgi:AraC-like DNA-binding protein
VKSHWPWPHTPARDQAGPDGTSYKDLLEEVRFDIARRYLRESSGSLTVLADTLDYAELSVFSNAFRRRYGMSARAWKKKQQEEEA